MPYHSYTFLIFKTVFKVIIAIGNTKGGVGKTTLAVQLAVTRSLAGRDVWLIDGDRQGTAAAAIAARSELRAVPGRSHPSRPGAAAAAQVG